eukprot:TRINITY_DN33612_c0_g1_i1.p1 TRINITY_DN33612_c0_g1~~TRINITY_DN33612_c0_g1_i1.p1  ORF type:complete len:103 (-),score=34.72 TRINITY_DN33612_c0_g1_i1:153-461(-)
MAQGKQRKAPVAPQKKKKPVKRQQLKKGQLQIKSSKLSLDQQIQKKLTGSITRSIEAQLSKTAMEKRGSHFKHMTPGSGKSTSEILKGTTKNQKKNKKKKST